MWYATHPDGDPDRFKRPAPPLEVTVGRVASRFGGTVDGALRQLGYPPPRPRELRQMTLACAEAMTAEDLLDAYERATDAGKAPEFSPEQARFFQELGRLAHACPGCYGLPGEDHKPGCPLDTED